MYVMIRYSSFFFLNMYSKQKNQIKTRLITATFVTYTTIEIWLKKIPNPPVIDYCFSLIVLCRNCITIWPGDFIIILNSSRRVPSLFSSVFMTNRWFHNCKTNKLPAPRYHLMYSVSYRKLRCSNYAVYSKQDLYLIKYIREFNLFCFFFRASDGSKDTGTSQTMSIA